MALFSKKSQQDSPRRRRQEASPQPLPEEDRYSFRRNRTLTGSASSKVASTTEANGQLKSARVHAHDLTKKRRHLSGLFFGVFLGASVFFFLIYQFSAGVTVKAQDVSMRLDPIYEKTIQEYFMKQPIERFRFLLNEKALSEYVQQRAPEVSSLRTEGSSGLSETSFMVTMRTPIAGWSVDGSQRYVDEEGVSFQRNYYSSPAVKIIDKSGIPVQSGKAVASNRFLGFVGLLSGLTKSYGYQVTEVIIPERTTRQVQLRLKDVPPPILFSIDRGAGEQAEDMSRSLTWFKSRNVTPEYIDVRVSGKAFYK